MPKLIGQNVQLSTLVDGEPVDMPVKSVSFTVKTKILIEGYLGESSNQYSNVFEGIGGSATVHMQDAKVLNFISATIARARDRAALSVFNLALLCRFDNGTRARVVFPDIAFDQQQFDSAGRDEFVEYSFDWGCSGISIVPA